MFNALSWLLFPMFSNLQGNGVPEVKQPNIVFIVADDLGWNDVGWNNPDMWTPNLDKLAFGGVILNQSYANPICAPSRSSYMTGYYPYRTGMQHGQFTPNRAFGVPLKFQFLPEKLKKLGYSTHMVGKWHLGFCKWEYTPTHRGFDSFYGFYTGGEDYYTHRTVAEYEKATNKPNMWTVIKNWLFLRPHAKDEGLDLRDNREVVTDENGKYSTELFAEKAERIIANHDKNKPLFLYLPFQGVHMPLQVPERYEKLYPFEKDKSRRVFSGMVSALDEAVGNVTAALTKHHLMDNTLIIFTSDNGGPPYGGANNWPLRGGKATLWEGGTRVPAFVYGPMLERKGYIHRELVHAVDWFSTIVGVAGGKTGSNVDGVNQMASISLGTRSKRKGFVYNIDEVRKRSAIRYGKYKLIEGHPGPSYYSGWYPTPSIKKNVPTKKYSRKFYFHNKKYLLYNIERDPTEKYDLSRKLPHIVRKMKQMLRKYQRHLHPASPKPVVAKSHPKHFGGAWSPGWC